MKRKVLLLAACFSWAGSLLAQTTGYNQAGAGPFDYNTPGNWVGGDINGLWDSSLTLTANQVTTFGANTPLLTGLNFNYAGSFNETLTGTGGDRTLTLGGNIIVDTADASRTITLGSITAGQALEVNLGGGTRTFSVGGNSGSARTLTLVNNVTNGGLLLNGGGIVNLNGNANTLSALRVQNTALRLTGTAAANSTTALSGALTIDGAATSVASNPDNLGGIATITLTPNAGRNITLSASALNRANKGVVFFRGNNLGGTLGANGVSNITFGTAPTLTGGGGASGSTNISILNWAVGSTTAGGGPNTFLTYDPVNGIRPLTSAEFQNYAADYSGAVTGISNSNTRIAAGTVTLTGDNTVNSLMMGETAVSTLAGAGTLTVTSGAVFVNRNSSAISLNLNFGAQEGIIGVAQPSSVIISGGIAGSGGLTVYQASQNVSPFSNGASVSFTNAATFTGDFTVNSRADISHSDFLAYGARTGNVVVNGALTLNGGGTDSRGYTMNGLNGNGRLSKAFSGGGLFRIGDNNANGNFTGIITDGGTTVVEKIGSGTQVFSGSNAYNGATRILGGNLEVTQLANGGVNSGIGKSTSIASNLILNGGTLKYSGAATSTDRLFQVGQTTTAAIGTIDASGSGAVNFTNTGAITYGTVGSTGTAQTRTLVLTGTNTGNNTLAAAIGNNGAAVNGNSNVSVTKSGTGTWVLSGANTYTGSTTVSGGTFVVSGTLNSASAISVNGGVFNYTNGAALANAVTIAGGNFKYNSSAAYSGALTFTSGKISGTGNLSGTALTIGAGQILSPGNSTGALSAGATTWADDGTFEFELNDATGLAGSTSAGWDLLNPTTLSITAGVGEFNLQIFSLNSSQAAGLAANFDGLSSYSWLFVDAGAAITGFNANQFVINTAGFQNAFTGTFGIARGDTIIGGDDTQLYLTYTAVPEPSAFALIGLSLSVLCFRRKRGARSI